MNDKNMEADIFFATYLPDALRQARDYAGDEGFVASMPQLLAARSGASFDNIIWNTWFTANSEENVVTTAQGNHALVTVHGGGIFATPERYRTLFHSSVNRHCETGFTGLFSGKITQQESQDILAGRLSDGTEMPVYSYAQFSQGISNLPRRYAVVMDLAMAKSAKNRYQSFDDLKQNPLMIARAGGVEAANAYLDVAQKRYQTTSMGCIHSYDNSELNPAESQCTVPLLSGNIGGEGADQDDEKDRGMDSEFGLQSGISMIYVARYVAVAPRDANASVRNLPF